MIHDNYGGSPFSCKELELGSKILLTISVSVANKIEAMFRIFCGMMALIVTIFTLSIRRLFVFQWKMVGLDLES